MKTLLVVYIIYEMGYALIGFTPAIVFIQIYLFHLHSLER